MGRRRADSAATHAAGTPAQDPQEDTPPLGRHFKKHQALPLWLKVTAITLSSVVVLGLATAGYLALRLQNNVTTAPLNAALTPGADGADNVEDTGSLQVLILGTDTRDGANAAYGTEEDSSGQGKSDVMLLVNLSADNSQVSITSFPRDLMVPIPDCNDAATGEVVPGTASGQLNDALAAGPGCTVAAINDMTGLTIDHFMLADFTAVKELTTALGGVEVCVDHAMFDDDGSFLRLPAGVSAIEGEQALAFLRTRHSFGDSSDLDRIKAQQYFLGSMARKLTSDGTLTNLPKLYNLADVVTKNLTIDTGLANIPSMISIASRLSKIDLASVSFVTVPFEEYSWDANRVQLQEPAAGQYFAALRSETSLTASAAAAATAAAEAAAAETAAAASAAAASATAVPPTSVPEPTPSAPPYDRSIQPISVVNASAVLGRATEILTTLATAGYTAAWNGGDVLAVGQSQVLHGSDMGDVAADLATLLGLPATAVRADPTLTGVQLLIGSDWPAGTQYGVVTVPQDIVASTADQGGTCLTVNPLYYTY